MFIGLAVYFNPKRTVLGGKKGIHGLCRHNRILLEPKWVPLYFLPANIQEKSPVSAEMTAIEGSNRNKGGREGERR